MNFFNLFLYFILYVYNVGILLSCKVDSKEKFSLSITNDNFKTIADSISCFENYDMLVYVSELYIKNHNTNIGVEYYLLSGYYFTNQINKSDSIINEIIESDINDSLGISNPTLGLVGISLINNDISCFNKYLYVDSNRIKIINKIATKYKNDTKILRPILASRIAYLTLNDQISRNQYSIKKSECKMVDKKMQNIDSLFKNNDSINRVEVFKFYKKIDRILSKKEIGSAYFSQFLLFAHEHSLENRSFYNSLIKRAFIDSIIELDILINFEIRTEMYVQKENFNLENTIKQYKIKYNYPNYNFKLY